MRTPLPLSAPDPHGFLYLGFHADPLQKVPLYRRTAGRNRVAQHLINAAEELNLRSDVISVRVFRAHLIPPLPGAPRHDLAMLIRTTRPADLNEVRESRALQDLWAEELLSGSNAARIGDTEAGTTGLTEEVGDFLFNHFTMDGDGDAVAVWTTLTEWYTGTIGVDNSTALQPDGNEQPYAVVNYARLPSIPPLFLLNQLLRPSFHRVVRGTLKRNRMRALPGFYRLVHVASTGSEVL